MASAIRAAIVRGRWARSWLGTNRDKDLTRLDGGGGFDPKYLVRDPKNGCKTILPHEYLRANTIFEVVKAAAGAPRGRQAPSYEWTNGPSGQAWTISTTEINSIPVALPQFQDARRTYPDTTYDDGWTNSFATFNATTRCTWKRSSIRSTATPMIERPKSEFRRCSAPTFSRSAS